MAPTSLGRSRKRPRAATFAAAIAVAGALLTALPPPVVQSFGVEPIIPASMFEFLNSTPEESTNLRRRRLPGERIDARGKGQATPFIEEMRGLSEAVEEIETETETFFDFNYTVGQVEKTFNVTTIPYNEGEPYEGVLLPTVNRTLESYFDDTEFVNSTTKYRDDKSFLPSKMSRIVGGSQISSMTRYSYLTAVFEKRGGKTAVLKCGGVLIASNAVLTAAHCGKNIDFVNINAHDLNHPHDEVESFYIKKFVVHPKYKSSPNPNYYDAMILILDGNSSMDTPLINYKGSTPSPRDELQLMGWGATKEGGKSVTKAREVTVKAIDNDDCEEYYKGERSFDALYSEHLCAFKPGKDACDYDSGGPLIKESSSASKDLLVGIVSYGIGCGELPGVYTRISEIEGWIDEVVDEYRYVSSDATNELSGQ
jgi:trypsin